MPGTTERELSFSAHSLQAYVDCARRFELAYLEQLKWPAVESEPPLENERHMADGRRFHEMIHREVLGIPVPEPDAGRDPDIARWWSNYQAQRPADVQGGTIRGEEAGRSDRRAYPPGHVRSDRHRRRRDGRRSGGGTGVAQGPHLRLEDLAPAAYEGVAG